MKRELGPATELTLVAHQAAIAMLQRHGNHVGPKHSHALWQLMQGFTNQGMHVTPGRHAYGLPCGSGKTVSIVAWIAAQHKLGIGLSVAVSAQQIKSLSDMKTALIAEGLPEPLIGIKHCMIGHPQYWPDTGDQDRPIMLGSHSRIQRSDEMPSFCRHSGKPRNLLIWDESLISSDTRTINVHEADSALFYFCNDGTRPMLGVIHQRLRSKVDEECSRDKAGNEPSVFKLITDEELTGAVAELSGSFHGQLARLNLQKVHEALRQFTKSMSLVNDGGGRSGLVLMSYRIVLDPGLENIAVLDASYVVSELCKADPTIRDATTTAMIGYKSFCNVLVKQALAPSGRWKFDDKADSALALKAAITAIRGIPSGESILVVTFLPRSGIDLARILKRELRACGIEADEELQERIRFTTWGKHTTDNSFAGFRHVLALGVLRQSSAVVAAMMAGQKDDASYRMTSERLAEVELSLLASNIMQAMSRGSCRKVDADGKALPMTLHLITKEKGLEPLLKQAMPGLQWETTSVAAPTRAEQAAAQIAAYVSVLPAETERVSKQAIFKVLGIEVSKDVRADAMGKALILLAYMGVKEPNARWVLNDKSLHRAGLT